jgi:hypothetical protein
MRKAVGDAARSAVMPKPDSVRKSEAWQRIAATAGKARTNPRLMPD